MSKSIGKLFGTGAYNTSVIYTDSDFIEKQDDMTAAELQQRLAEMFPLNTAIPSVQEIAAQDLGYKNLQANALNPTGVQYAQNEFANTTTDAQYVNNPNYISDEDLLAKMWGNVKKYKGIPSNPYLDIKGNITGGAGANINNKEDFMKVNFMINGRPATDTEKEKYFYKLRDMSMMVDRNNNFIHRNTKAEDFSVATPLTISDEEAYNIATHHMKNDLARVRQQFSDFDAFPEPLKEVLLDIQYNTGNLTRQNWPNLYQAIENKDVNGIIANVHRKDVGQERNDWAESMVRSIRF